jgi:hypothetical protein
MPLKAIKLTKKDDLASVVKRIKALRDRQIIFELEKDSPLLKSSDSLRLMKKTGEVMGKTVKIQTTDPMGQILAKKAGVLDENVEIKTDEPKRAGANPKPGLDSPKIGARFSDIVSRRPVPDKPPAPVDIQPKPVMAANMIKPAITRGVDGTRMEIDMAGRGSSSSRFSKIFIFILIVLVLGVFGLAVLLPKADVKIFARSEPISRDLEISVDKSIVAANSSTLEIPGIMITKEISQTKSFPTTGTKVSGNKAAGVVTIYNATPSTLTLRAATTTLISSGKKYFFAKDVSGIKPNNSPTTGIGIIAEQAGPDYNLPANAQFQIVNQALGNRNVYAVNPQALAGGTTADSVKVLSQADLDTATASLMNDVINAAEDDLTAQYSTKIRIEASGVKKDILAKTANKDIGAQVDTFDMTLIARVSGLAFRDDDVVNLVISKINEVLSSDKYLLDGAKKQYTGNFKTADLVAGKGILDIHFETVAAYKVDDTNMPKILAGKNESEIKEILLSKPEIDNVEVKFWPAWFVHKAPRFNGKIKIETVASQ